MSDTPEQAAYRKQLEELAKGLSWVRPGYIDAAVKLGPPEFVPLVPRVPREPKP